MLQSINHHCYWKSRWVCEHKTIILVNCIFHYTYYLILHQQQLHLVGSSDAPVVRERALVLGQIWSSSSGISGCVAVGKLTSRSILYNKIVTHHMWLLSNWNLANSNWDVLSIKYMPYFEELAHAHTQICKVYHYYFLNCMMKW